MSQNIQKVAIVTGGGSGLGLATSEKFVKEGIKTIIIGRDPQKLADAKAALGELIHPIVYDLSILNGIPDLVTSIQQKFGRIDILVNNAGINMKKELIDVSDEDFLQVINTNVLAVFAISREVSKVMITQQSGAIVMISSMAAKYGIPKVIAYTAAKSAIEGMTKAMAVELSPQGIRVNCVAPGFIVTEMSSKALNNDPERKNKVLGRTPMGFLGETMDVAEAAYYFASDASKYVTGASLAVDGGNSIGF
ncbi:SDR family NAD(P)-dependent oxidoreductase [Belliella pelovolcani]|uniref:NAD(P)-dependent dehydrogenase, short-chain alcohol dehydrogenase family n=1 Tax=Belliella pelovolcani TaxID=529505 RepID=A0A1N7MSN1_9BACT|nr:SDR family oxidoreductase [Belliella pelovolcani]SIS89133.1 NAD(P)-dependent dehydrogenase, short-chain alcohol dehydrogenase family [Belliella pelovolcani]